MEKELYNLTEEQLQLFQSILNLTDEEMRVYVSYCLIGSVAFLTLMAVKKEIDKNRNQ